MTKRDFSILFEKVSTPSGIKDIALVKGFNAYSQYIENVCKTQKGEVISDLNLGSDYYSYIFDGKANKGELETAMASYIAASIKNIFNVKVVLKYSTETLFQFVITYDISDGISKISNASTFVEVEL